MSTKPSPTPWKVDETWFSIESAESDLVVDCENASNKNQLANLRLIVRAVNNHERLVKALRDLYDEQNGAPLVKRAHLWEVAMHEAEKLLSELEQLEQEAQ